MLEYGDTYNSAEFDGDFDNDMASADESSNESSENVLDINMDDIDDFENAMKRLTTSGDIDGPSRKRSGF